MRHAARLAAPARRLVRRFLDHDVDLGLVGVRERDDGRVAATTRSSRMALYQPGS